MRLKDFGEIRKSLLNTLEWNQGIATGRSRLITQENFLYDYLTQSYAELSAQCSFRFSSSHDEGFGALHWRHNMLTLASTLH